MLKNRREIADSKRIVIQFVWIEMKADIASYILHVFRAHRFTWIHIVEMTWTKEARHI